MGKEKKINLPLDDARYDPLRERIKEMLKNDPELFDTKSLREFLETYKNYFGTRTLAEISIGADDLIRRTIHYMVLSSTDLEPFHESSRKWLKDNGYQLPPWDSEVTRKAHRVIEYKGRVAAVVEWEPNKNITLDPNLSESERNWVLAMAIGAGEKPEWNYDELRTFAAYLTMGGKEFSKERNLSNKEIAEKYSVPVEEVEFRRKLPDSI